MTGTIFHGTKMPLRTWLFVVFEMCANKNGIAAREIERKYGVAPKTAWFMTHRLREAMKNRPRTAHKRHRVADETWIGADAALPARLQARAGRPGQMRPDKTPVVALVERESGEVRSRVIPNVTGENLRKRPRRERRHAADDVLYTDSEAALPHVSHQFAAHHTVNHREREYVRGNVTRTRPRTTSPS